MHKITGITIHFPNSERKSEIIKIQSVEVESSKSFNHWKNYFKQKFLNENKELKTNDVEVYLIHKEI